ncbi:MAG: protein kinase [Acidobacteriota bacterium]
MKLTVKPGTRVADRFSILRFIAEGGMGEVYEAEDEILGERVALKFLSHRNVGDEQVTRRFRREIQLARKVTHPNVCRLFDVYQHEIPGPVGSVQVAFVTMELLEGETLEDRLERDGPMGEEEALPIVVQMSMALAAAHDAGVIHRDFKSNNVMLVAGEDGAARAVVTDFGLARSMMPGDPTRTPLTADQLILGTADYMSPEQIRGEPVSPASDLYALGVVMFEMITGRKPYRAANPMQLLVQRVSKPPARPRDFAPSVSELWEAVIMQCLAEQPEDRPASARDIVRELEVDEELGPAEPAPAQRLGGPAPKPRRGAGPWLAVAVLALAVIAFWSSRRQPPVANPFSPVRVTTAPGLELDPTFSPEGDRIAYSAETSTGGFDLFVQDLEGGTPRRLETQGPSSFEPDWSPVDDRIAYTGDQRGGLWLISALGGEPLQMTDRGSRPAFAPDGARLAFQSGISPLLSDTTAPAMAPSQIELLNLGDRAVEALTQQNRPEGGHGAPTWTPDGRFVVFSAAGRSISQLWAVEVATRRLVPLVLDPAAAYDPVVAADGTGVYFTSRSREVKGLWRIDVDPSDMTPQGEPREVAGVGLSSIRQPVLSRDGTRLLYSAYLTRSNLYASDVDPGSGAPLGPPEPLTQGNDRHSRPVFSPDGRTLAFDHWQLGVEMEIWLAELEGGQRRQLTRSADKSSQASWLTEGRVAFVRHQGTQRRLLAIDPVAGTETLLADLPSDVDWAAVSPDGSRISYHTAAAGQSFDVWVRELPQGEPWRLTFHEQLAGFPCWSPDSRQLAYQVRSGDDTHLWVTTLESDPRLLVDLPGHSWPYSFSPDGTKIAFAGQRGGRWNLYWVSVMDGEIQPVTNLQGLTGYLRYPTWSPDGGRIVYERSETTSDLFLVDGFL